MQGKGVLEEHWLVWLGFLGIRGDDVFLGKGVVVFELRLVSRKKEI